MIKFTRTRRDWDDMEFAQRMLRAGNEGYQSLYYEPDFDDYVLISTATEKQLRGNYTDEDLASVWEELETLGKKQSKTFEVSGGEKVILYWEIDRFSK